MPSASTKNGNTRNQSKRFHWPRRHHAHNNIAPGNTTVDGLLNIAAAPHTTART